MDYKVKGFKFSGISAQIKKNNKKDLGLILCDEPFFASAVFTQNKVKAAPVILSMQNIKNKCHAVVVNSGNANCSTEKSFEDASSMSKILEENLKIKHENVIVASTGVIGEPLPIEKILKKKDELISRLDENNCVDFLEAICTTDSFEKIAYQEIKINGKTCKILGVAKGAGMIEPNLATMLSFILTDADIEKNFLDEMLKDVCDNTFNKIIVDGDTSTNDMVLMIASAKSGVKINNDNKTAIKKALEKVCLDLSKLIVKDGEGATKLCKLRVIGAKTHSCARKCARCVANSLLFKTALFGESVNWGRILGAIGRSGVDADFEKIDIYFDDTLVVKNSNFISAEAEISAKKVLKQAEFEVLIDLRLGDKEDFVYTSDIGIDYIKINSDYKS